MTLDVVCFGETMALLAPDPPVRLVAAENLALGHAGAESNVAVSLARLGTRARWCSRVGDDAFGQRILAAITAAGVDTSTVQVCAGARTGVFFKDPDGDMTSVHYYRDGSAASQMTAADVDRALTDVPRVLHLTGVTPVLSPSCADAVEHALVRARETGCILSFDVNYRSALWPEPDLAARTLTRLAQSCDIVFVGLDEAARLWGTTCEASVRGLLDRPSVLVVKDGPRSATAFEDGRRTRVLAIPTHVVDAVGAGDAFAAGWLHARLTGMSATEQLRLGHLVAARSLSSVSDHGVDSGPLAGLPELARADRDWPPPPIAQDRT